MAAACAAVALAAAVVVGAGACLPELSAIPAEDSPSEGAPPPFVGCGDGVIATLDDGGDAGESCDPGKPNAQVAGCKECQVTCDGGTPDHATGHCYFASGAATSYSEALTHCALAGAHVVTFASQAEATIVEGIAHDANAGFWVGLSRSPNLKEAYGPDPARAEEPGFPYPPSGPCAGCFGVGADPADASVFPIADDAGGSPRCLASRGGAWFQVECSPDVAGGKGVARSTICEREPPGARATDCSDGFCFTLASTAGKKTYLVSKSGADPDQAAQSCAVLDGGSLVVLESAEEREQLAHEILALGTAAAELWIGLAKDGGAWSWEDGVPAVAGSARALPWGNAQPSDSASGRAFMRLAAPAYDTQLAYADDGGRSPRLYVCQRPPR